MAYLWGSAPRCGGLPGRLAGRTEGPPLEFGHFATLTWRTLSACRDRTHAVAAGVARVWSFYIFKRQRLGQAADSR